MPQYTPSPTVKNNTGKKPKCMYGKPPPHTHIYTSIRLIKPNIFAD
jgi:hypothetical protein